MMVEGFCRLAPAFVAAHLPHQVMEWPNGVVIKRLGLKRLVIAILDGAHNHIVCGVKVLRLGPQLRFEVGQRKLLAAGEPSAVGKQQGSAVVHVEIDGSVGKDNIRLVFVQQKLGKLLIALTVNFRPGAVRDGQFESAAVRATKVEAIQANLQVLGHLFAVYAVLVLAVLRVGPRRRHGSASDRQGHHVVPLFGI